MMKRFKLYTTLIIFICLFSLGANIGNGVFTDSLICSHKYVFRIVRDVNFELVPGRFYTPKELVQRGYTLEEMTLEKIVEPEAIPEDEEFIIYEVSKDSKVIGWLGQERFLDKEKLQKRYELFIEAHARMDNILAEGELDKEIQKDLDILRNRMHLWAKLFGHILNKRQIDVVIDIINTRLFLLKDWERLEVVPGNKEIAKFFGDNEIFVNFENDVVTLMQTHSEGVDYTNILLEMIAEFDKEFTEYTEEKHIVGSFFIQTDIHGPNSGYIYDSPYIVQLFSFHKSLYPLIRAQLDFLVEKIIESHEEENKEGSMLEELEEVDWFSKFPKLKKEIEELKLIKCGKKALNLNKLKNTEVPVPDFRILKSEDISSIDMNAVVEIIHVWFNYDTVRAVLRGKYDILMLDTIKKDGIPILMSVRSSPSISMPGVLKTILNVGITDKNFKKFIERNDEYFAYETYARFLRSFGTGAFGIDKEVFGNIPKDLNTQAAIKLVERYKELIKERGFEIPQDPYTQLKMAIEAVRNSWNSDKARRYREENGIPDDLDMAVIIQEMKFGNLNENSGSFVLFTRDPVTGEKGLYIEYAPQSQGDTLVGGEIDPVPIEESGLSQEIIDEIKEYAEKIEKEFGYVQDIEGVIEDGKVWILQTRDAKLSSGAEIKALVDMVEEGILTKEEALLRINLEDLEDRLSHMQIDPTVGVTPIASGLGASSGAVQGVIAFDLESIKEFKNNDLPVILVKKEFYPANHLEELRFSDGLLTQIGGKLSHGAIQGRIHEKPTIVGANIEVDMENKTVIIGGKTYKQGDYITIDGTNGDVYEGRVDLIEPEGENPYLEILKQWYEEIYGEI